MEYLAHIAEDGRTQTVEEHLAGTARRSRAFAAEFGAGDYGELVGSAHDIGKMSREFQERLRGGKKVDHASAGALECARMDQMLAALCVAGHHSGLADFGNPATDRAGDPTFIGRLHKALDGRIPDYFWQGQLKEPAGGPEFEDDFALSFWVRMLYSCLVDADFLDTEAFMSGGTVERADHDPLPVLLERLEKYIAPWFPPKNSLNRMRCEILQTCLDAGDRPKGIYTLTVPTGGGKTVASLAFALRHAVRHQMKRVIYVIPYTSIIEQNAAVFRGILGERNVVEHHSGAGFDTDEETGGSKSAQRLAAENWDAPVIVTTAVQFFESLYGSRSSKCRKLHNIANSVIIFDEAQMIPTAHLLPCVGAFTELAAHFGASVVLCTATQPVLNDLIRRFAPGISVEEICPDAAGLYERSRRVTFRDGGKLSNEELAEALSEQAQVLCIVNTRKAAQEIYELLPQEGRFHLSTLMYPAHRQAVLGTIRSRLKDGLPCRVVSTSLIEAGVDIDFPTVYREFAGLDSILQAAGRCNREGKRGAEESVVTYFTGQTPPPALFRTGIGAAREALSGGRDPGDPESIRRYFTACRSLVGENLDKTAAVARMRDGIHGWSLPFETVAEKFRLIDEATRTVYIPRGAGDGLCRSLLSGCAGKETYRRAGQYSVSVYDGHYHALLDAGDIRPLDQDSAVLLNVELYDPEQGLSTRADTGKAEFI